MKKSAAPPTTNPIANGPRPSSQRLHIGREFADTTWRIAVPVVIGAGLGISADRQLGSRPWVTLLGSLIGFIGAGLLVKRQIGDWENKV